LGGWRYALGNTIVDAGEQSLAAQLCVSPPPGSLFGELAVEASSLKNGPQRPRRFGLTWAGYIIVAGIVLSVVHEGVQHFFGPMAAAIGAGITVAIFGVRPIYRETESVPGAMITAMLTGLIIGTVVLVIL
jgi:hypothetical protein